MTENEQKADLIKKSLVIVDELGKLDMEDVDEIEDLIERAEKLKKNVHWKLK